MRKLLTLTLSFCAFAIMQSNAQDYTIAGGIGFDLGNGANFFGPSAKYFFAEEHAVQAEILFETNVTAVNALYHYNGSIAQVDNLNWFAGGGISLWLISNGLGNELALRPTAGVEYIIESVPLVLSFDWRPFIGLGDLGNEVGTFGLGVKYVFQ